MQRFSNFLHKLSSGRAALFGLIVFVLFIALVMPRFNAHIEASGHRSSSGPRSSTPDLSFYYAPQALYELAQEYGPAGRQAYIQARFTFDLVWPLVYTFFLVTSVSWLVRRGFPPGSRWQYANLIPLAAMTLDFLENISTSLVMYRFPARWPLVEFLAPLFTALKWIAVGGSFALALIGAAAVLWRTGQKR